MRTLAVTIFFLAAVGTSQAAELIFLKDGTVVKGEVTASTEKSVTAVVAGTTYTVSADKFDPHFFYRLHEIMELRPNWGVICLYSAKFHAPRRNRAEVNPIDRHTTVRGMAAGISMFFRVESFRSQQAKVQVPDGRGWDGYYSQTFGARKVVQSLVSYVEHYGKWGFHNKGNFDRDRALNPTQYLAGKRPAAIKKIEATFIETQKAVAERKRKEDAKVKS